MSKSTELYDIIFTIDAIQKNLRLARLIDVDAFNKASQKLNLPFRLVKEDDGDLEVHP